VAGPQASVRVSAQGLPIILSAPPREFDGPGDQWSPESLLVASVADCFVLTFRAISRPAKLEWRNLECQVEGVLERVDGITQFSGFSTRATLTLPPGADKAKAQLLLEKAERGCLIANSLRGTRSLTADIQVDPA
jgi:organic hydroperoxide reductase OsmC/OhrA